MCSITWVFFYNTRFFQFEKQSEMMDMKEEIMGDAIDDALGDPADDEESENIVNQVLRFSLQHLSHCLYFECCQVLDELGIQMGEEMAGLPSAAGKIGTGATAEKGKQAVAAGGL